MALGPQSLILNCCELVEILEEVIDERLRSSRMTHGAVNHSSHTEILRHDDVRRAVAQELALRYKMAGWKDAKVTIKEKDALNPMDEGYRVEFDFVSDPLVPVIFTKA
jgi:hypothetical protein